MQLLAADDPAVESKTALPAPGKEEAQAMKEVTSAQDDVNLEREPAAGRDTGAVPVSGGGGFGRIASGAEAGGGDTWANAATRQTYQGGAV